MALQGFNVISMSRHRKTKIAIHINAQACEIFEFQSEFCHQVRYEHEKKTHSDRKIAKHDMCDTSRNLFAFQYR